MKEFIDDSGEEGLTNRFWGKKDREQTHKKNIQKISLVFKWVCGLVSPPARKRVSLIPTVTGNRGSNEYQANSDANAPTADKTPNQIDFILTNERHRNFLKIWWQPQG